MRFGPSTCCATVAAATRRSPPPSRSQAANSVYELVRGDTSGGAAGEALTVTPVRKLGDKSKDSAVGAAEFAGRIKLTWADGAPTGDAKVFFLTPHDANTFVRTARTIFQSTTMKTFAAGQLPVDSAAAQNAGNLPMIGRATVRSPPKNKSQHGQAGASQSAPLAPTKKEMTGGADGFLMVFDTDAIGAMSLEQQSRLRFGVNIKGGLPPSMDECELTDVIRRTIPGVGYAKVSRKPVTSTVASTELELQVRFSRMLPLLTCLDETSVHTDFVDQGTRRAGVVVFCRDLPRLTETYQMARDSPLWGELEKPHGQPIRMALEHSYTTSLHAEVLHCFREQIAGVITYARAKGIEYQESQPTALAASSSATKNMVTLKFLGELRVLQRVKAKLDECLQSEKVESPDIHWLFGTVARYKLAAITDKHNAETNSKLRYFIRWIVKKNKYWVYGDAPSRAHAVALLHRLIAELKSLEVVDRGVRIFVKKDGKPDGKSDAAKGKAPNIRQWLTAAPTARALYSYVVKSNRMIYVAGSESQVAALMQALQKDGLAYQEPKRGAKRYGDAGNQAKPDCSVCYMAADEPNIVLPICNHTFDLECIQNMIQPATCTFPLNCPAPGCGQPLRVDDASKILNDADAFSSLVETAVLDYVARHRDQALICPKPGCNQILSVSTITGAANAVGGRAVYCEQCEKSYCLECSEAATRPVARHAKQTCEQFRSRQLSPQILNVACPHCHSVFLDFSGCTSVQCGNATCGRYFCANCLVYSSTSSGETHHHVARCPSNPNPASAGGVKGYFTTDEQLAATHRALRTQKLEAYFRERLLSDPMRCTVFRKLQRDLADLGVELPVELQAAHAAHDASFMFGDDDEDVESPQDAAVRRHVKHVREELLNLKCPQCGLVFVDFDFDSCAALTCAKPSCPGGICAYCLAQCGSDAHAHVSKCEKNPNKPYYYTTEADVLAVHKKRREGLVAKYLAESVRPNEGADMVQRVKAALADDFRSIGLDIAAV